MLNSNGARQHKQIRRVAHALSQRGDFRRNQDEADVLKGSSQAAASYLQRVAEHDAFMSAKIAEFDIGKRHLANMMGEDPATFTQDDVNRCIEYLLPSGLYRRAARPSMRPPEEVYAQTKEAQFDGTGRPHHSLFYTGNPNFYQTMHEIAVHQRDLDRHEDDVIRRRHGTEVLDRIELAGSTWISQEKLGKMLFEEINDIMYQKFTLAMDRLCAHPYSGRIKEWVGRFRAPLDLKTVTSSVAPLQYDEAGRPFQTAVGTRKHAKALVKVLGEGSGKVSINGCPITYFQFAQEREQIALPLLVAGLLNKVDIIARTERGSYMGQAGAIRYALSQALTSFVDEETVERMRIAGLLTLDVRRKERFKPGQKHARAKFTWRKR